MAAAGRDRVPMLGLWPRRARYGVVLRHDVEGSEGVRNVAALRRLEEAAGLRSIWNFVPERYPFDWSTTTDLQQAGHEIGVHGLYHDGKLFSSRREFVRRAETHQRLPVGLGSPWLRRAVGDPEDLTGSQSASTSNSTRRPRRPRRSGSGSPAVARPSFHSCFRGRSSRFP